MTITTHDRPRSAVSESYLAAVGAALAGVPDSDRQELLDDLAEHLGELAPENETVLMERLGPPEQYAAELLASAGIETTARSRGARSKLAERSRAAVAMLDTPAAQRARTFARELAPGWWVARAWFVLAAIAARNGLQEAIWVPNLTHHRQTLDVVLLAGAIVLSVKIGRGPSTRTDHAQTRRWAAWIATAVGVVAVLSLLGADRSYYYRVDTVSTVSNTGTLLDPSGNLISNIFAYDGSGHPIARFFLFNQDGVPVDVGDGGTLQSNGIPYVSGLFPRPTVNVDDTSGAVRAVQPTPPPVSVPQLPQPEEPAGNPVRKPAGKPAGTVENVKPTTPTTSP